MIEFIITESKIIPGIKIIKPSISKDMRGNIWTSYQRDEIDKLLPDKLEFKHDKFSCSKKNVLRGIHGDQKSWKLITCVSGSIFQVVVDCRKKTSTYEKYDSFTIDNNNHMSILIPPGLGNAYYALSDNVVYHYKLAYEGKYIDADEQFSYKWNDPIFKIKWPSDSPILSKRDR